jgi:hypothetical protein
VRKTLNALIVAACALIIILAGMWAAVIYYVIPQIALPLARDYVNTGGKGLLRIHVDNLGFDPLAGFSVRGLTVSGPSGLFEGRILHADTVDIDIDWFALLQQKVVISGLKILSAELTLGRGKEGLWNFVPAAGADALKPKQIGRFDIVIREVVITQSRLKFTDTLDANNTLFREFTDLDLCLTNPDGRRYALALSARAQARTGEHLTLTAIYDSAADSLKGRLAIKTAHLGEYWQYYLDEMMQPWKVWADTVGVEVNFSSQGRQIGLNGRCVIDNGVISYGTIALEGYADAQFKFICTNGAVDTKSVRVGLAARQARLSSGSTELFRGGSARAVLTEDKIEFEELKGTAGTVPVSMKGRFVIGPSPALTLSGALGRTGNDITLAILQDDRGTVDWRSTFRSSSVKLHVDIRDLKQLILSVTAAGTVDLEEIAALAPAFKPGVKGQVVYDAHAKGRLSDLSTITGAMTAEFRDLSLFGTELKLAKLNMAIRDGELEGDIPETAFCGGTVAGKIRMDHNRWGFESACDGVDIRRPASVIFEQKNVSGICTARAACVGAWGAPEDARGAGYFTLLDSNLWGIPLFYATEKGIEQIKKDFSATVFQKVSGTFRIEDKAVVLDKVVCKGSVININVNGRVAFSGVSNFTAVAQFLGSSSVLRTLRYIIMPKSVVLDIIQDALQMKIHGTWPDLSCSISIEPLAFIKQVFSIFDGWEKEKFEGLDERWSRR